MDIVFYLKTIAHEPPRPVSDCTPVGWAAQAAYVVFSCGQSGGKLADDVTLSPLVSRGNPTLPRPNATFRALIKSKPKLFQYVTFKPFLVF